MIQFDGDPAPSEQLAIVPFAPGTPKATTPAAAAQLAIVPFVPPGNGDMDWVPLPDLGDLAEFVDEEETQRSDQDWTPTTTPRPNRHPPALTPSSSACRPSVPTLSPSPWEFWCRSSGQVGEGRVLASGDVVGKGRVQTQDDADLLAEAQNAPPLNAKSVKAGVRRTKPNMAAFPPLSKSSGGDQKAPQVAAKVRCALKPHRRFLSPRKKKSLAVRCFASVPY